MLLNAIKLILRGFKKDKSYFFINVIGLALGLTSFILIALFVTFEMSYDRFHRDHDSIYRVYTVMQNAEGEEKVPFTADPLVPEMQIAWPQIEEFVRVKHVSSTRVTSEEHAYHESNTFFVESNFFEFFDFKLAVGDKNTVLKKPFSAVISQKLSQKYFGQDNPVGKVIKVERDFFNDVEFTITGVSEAVPKNSHIDFDLLLSFESSYHGSNVMLPNNWWWTTAAYMKVTDGRSLAEINEGMTDFIQGHSVAKKSPMGSASFSFTSLTDLHTSDLEVKDDYAKKQSRQHMLLFSGIAILVLALAIINYVNLTIVKSIEGSRKIGIQKVLGASRKWLIKRHILESFVFCSFSVVLALLIIELILTGFNQIVNSDILVPYDSPIFIGGMVFLIALVGFISGVYPAVYLSKFKMVDSLKDSVNTGKPRILKYGLVIFQFVISQGLIITSLIIYGQLEFMMKAENSGLEPESVIVVPLYRSVKSSELDVLKENLVKSSDIVNASYASPAPGVDNYHGGVQGKQLSAYDGDPNAYFSYRSYSVDYQFKDVLGMSLTAGRWYDPEIRTDRSNAVVINESAAKHFGWGEDALGQTITKYDSTLQHVIGIVRDFHTESFQYPILPAVFELAPEERSYAHLLVKFRSESATAVLDKLRREWSQQITSLPFDYYFLDDYFEAQYTAELKLKRLIISLSVLAILIAVLGVYGLTSFTIQQRTKEVGIRKVLGASYKQIALLLTRQVYLLITLGFTVAVPIAYYFNNEWLTGYAYRIEANPVLFVMTLLFMLCLALTSIASITYRSVRRNPVESLRVS